MDQKVTDKKAAQVGSEPPQLVDDVSGFVYNPAEVRDRVRVGVRVGIRVGVRPWPRPEFRFEGPQICFINMPDSGPNLQKICLKIPACS